MVSGSVSLPSRGSFHLSLTVLFSIARRLVFSLGGWSPLLPTRFHVSRGTLVQLLLSVFSPTGFLPSLTHGSSCVRLSPLSSLTANPNGFPLGSGCFRFARRYFGNRVFFLFLRILRCFSSPSSPKHTMFSYAYTYTLLYVSSLIRISPGHWLFAPSRSFSQLTTSFIGYRRQGIRHMLFFLLDLGFSFFCLFCLCCHFLVCCCLFSFCLLSFVFFGEITVFYLDRGSTSGLFLCFFVSLFLPSVFSRLAHFSVISFLDDVCSFQGTFLWVVS